MITTSDIDVTTTPSVTCNSLIVDVVYANGNALDGTLLSYDIAAATFTINGSSDQNDVGQH